MQNIFVTFSGEFAAVNMCIHIYSVTDNDGRDCLCLACRRFFSEQVAKIDRIIYSLEFGEISGIVIQNKDVLAPHEKLDFGDFDQLDAVVRFPRPLLRKLGDFDDEDFKFTLTAQFNFKVFTGS